MNVQGGSGEPAGTAMAWYGSLLPGRPAGRLHWVGIRRQHQGQGIGKSLASRAMEVMSAWFRGARYTAEEIQR